LKQLNILGQSKFGWVGQLIRNNLNISGAGTDSRDTSVQLIEWYRKLWRKKNDSIYQVMEEVNYLLIEYVCKGSSYCPNKKKLIITIE
jgi:hypothetical protein